MLSTALHGRNNVRLYRLQRLNYDILDAIHYSGEIDSRSLKMLLELCEVPLAGILLLFVTGVFTTICARILDIILILFVD